MAKSKGRYRTYLNATGSELIPQYVDADGVIFPIGNNMAVAVCGQCGEVFRQTETQIGAICPECGAKRFEAVPYASRFGGVKNVVTKKGHVTTLTVQQLMLRIVGDKSDMEFLVSNSKTFSWDGNVVSASGSVKAMTMEELSALVEGDKEVLEAADICEESRSGYYYGRDGSIIISHLNDMIDVLRVNPKIRQLKATYPDEVLYLVREHTLALKTIYSFKDICDYFHIPKGLEGFHKYLYTNDKLGRYGCGSVTAAEMIQMIQQSPQGTTMARYIERDAFDGNTITEIYRTINFINMKTGRKHFAPAARSWEYSSYERDVQEQEERSYSQTPAGPAIENDVLEMFYDFQAKNCLIYGGCWQEFIYRVRTLMNNGDLITAETLDTKSFYTNRNKQMVGKPKFYELVVENPLEAVKYL